MQRRRASVRLALVAALASSPAAAQTLSNAAAPWGNAPPPPPLSPAPAFVEPLPKPPMESYAAASWAVFGGSVALTATYAFSNGLTVVPGTLGLTGLVFGGPIVHWVNGRVGHGFVVLGVNLAASAVGFGLGLGIACSSRCGGGRPGPQPRQSRSQSLSRSAVTGCVRGSVSVQPEPESETPSHNDPGASTCLQVEEMGEEREVKHLSLGEISNSVTRFSNCANGKLMNKISKISICM
jgi:hypothetical protein